VIQLDGIRKGYGGRELCRDVSWRLGSGERVGLVGPNGVGKTTLCRILAGLEEPDAGVVSRARTTTVGYLPQDVAASTEESVLAEALGGFEDVWRLEREMERVAGALAETRDDALTARYGELAHRFEALGGYRLETEAKAILGGLGFVPSELARPLTEFSGGWRMRAALARLLLLRPSLLLLDEPTNHLDLESLAWLESFLGDYDGTVVVVSHDRYFLNRMVTSIAELSPAGLTVYPGDYDAYLTAREARRELVEAQVRNQARRVAEIERFIERFRYQATKARQVQSRIKMLDRLERVELAPEAKQVRFAFPAPPRTGRRVATLRGIHKAYGATIVYTGVDFEVERGERVALVGPNGAGKSTLLRILAGGLPFEQGERTLGAQVALHYYAQHQLDALDPRRTVFEELEAVAPELGRTRLRTLLGAFLFSGDAVDKRVAVLSGGEKARLALARMLVRPAALLALDEPTNHLDVASREVLEDALGEFPGTIVFISHDRYFINRIATRIVEIEHGGLTSYLGDYDEYLAARARRPAAPVPASPSPIPGASSRRASPAAPGATPSPARHRRRALSVEIRKLRARLETVERRIDELEGRLREITTAAADPDLYRDGARARAVAAEQKRAESEVAWLLREWEELSRELSTLE
jgi:ATP-binding cassette, subfamily F, member 3